MKKYRIANRFRELLAIKGRNEGKNISQREVAEVTGLSKTTVDRIARNETSRYDEHVLLAICNYFDCSVGELLIIQEEVGAQEGQRKTLLASV